MDENAWSDWLDYNKENIANLPNSSGVFMMHASMKILYIDSSEDLKETLGESLNKPCISEATRFRYMITSRTQEIKNELIQDFRNRHEGKLPRCMEAVQ